MKLAKHKALALGLTAAMCLSNITPALAYSEVVNSDGTTTSEISSTDKNMSSTTHYKKPTTVVSNAVVDDSISDELGYAMKVTIPNELPLTYNQATKDFNVDAYTKVSGMLDSKEYIEVKIPNELDYSLNGNGNTAFTLKPTYASVNNNLVMYPTETYKNITEQKKNNINIYITLDDIKSDIKIKGTYKANCIFNTKIAENEKSLEPTEITDFNGMLTATGRTDSLSGSAIVYDDYTEEITLNTAPAMLSKTDSIYLGYNVTKVGNSLSLLGSNESGVPSGTIYTNMDENEFERKFNNSDNNIPSTLTIKYKSKIYNFKENADDLYVALGANGVDVDDWSSLTSIKIPETTEGLFASAVDSVKDFSNLDEIHLYSDKYVDTNAFATLGTSKAATIYYYGTEAQWDAAKQRATDDYGISQAILNSNVTVVFLYTAGEVESKADKLALADWEYTINDSNDTITLNKYIGNNPDVVVEGKYKVSNDTDAKEYSTIANGGLFQNNAVVNTVTFDDSKGKIKAADDSSNMFSSTYDDSNGFTSNILELNLSGLDTSETTNIDSMFSGCNNIQTLNLENFNTASISSMNNVFSGCENLSVLNLTGFDTKDLSDYDYIFSDTANLSTVYVGDDWSTDTQWDNGADTTMFDNCGTDHVTRPSKNQAPLPTKKPSTSNSGVTGSKKNVTNPAKSSVDSIIPNKSTTKNIEGTQSTPSTDDANYKLFNDDWQFELDKSKKTVTLKKYIGTNKKVGVQGKYNLKVVGVDSDYAEYTTIIDEGLFSYTNVEEVAFDNTLGAIKVKNLANMFAGCTNLYNVVLSAFDMSDVTSYSARYMFSGCESLQSIDLSKLDTSKCTDMAYMFRDTGLKTVDVSNFNTSKVTDMSGMFMMSDALKSVDGLTSFDTSNVHKLDYMFSDCESLESVDLGSFTKLGLYGLNDAYHQYGNIDYMFNNCKNIETIDMSGMTLLGVQSMNGTFKNCEKLKNLSIGDTTNLIRFTSTFMNCKSLESLDLSGMRVLRATNANSAFKNCSNLTSLSLKNWKVPNLKYMGSMFEGCSSLETLDLTSFNPIEGVMSEDNSSNTTVCNECGEVHTGRSYWVHNMFKDCENLTMIKVRKSWPTNSLWDGGLDVHNEQVVFPNCGTDHVTRVKVSDDTSATGSADATKFCIKKIEYAGKDDSGYNKHIITEWYAIDDLCDYTLDDEAGTVTINRAKWIDTRFGDSNCPFKQTTVKEDGSENTNNCYTPNIYSKYTINGKEYTTVITKDTFTKASNVRILKYDNTIHIDGSCGWSNGTTVSFSNKYGKIKTPEDMSFAFSGLSEVWGLSALDVSGTKNMTGMFYYNSTRSLDLSTWDFTNAESIDAMFGMSSMPMFDELSTVKVNSTWHVPDGTLGLFMNRANISEVTVVE